MSVPSKFGIGRGAQKEGVGTVYNGNAREPKPDVGFLLVASTTENTKEKMRRN